MPAGQGRSAPALSPSLPGSPAGGAAFLAAALLVPAFFAGAFLADAERVDFFAAVFLAPVFLAGALSAVFFAGAAFAVVALAGDAGALSAAAFFAGGVFAVVALAGDASWPPAPPERERPWRQAVPRAWFWSGGGTVRCGLGRRPLPQEAEQRLDRAHEQHQQT